MKKLLIVMAIGTTAIYGTYKVTRSQAPAVTGVSLTQDRIWIDHVPRNDRDTMQFFFALSTDPFGLFSAASQWAGQHEIFQYEMNGEQMRLVFPQNGDKEKVTAKAKKCDEGEFDFCLELSGSSRGVKRYYSMDGWEVDHLTAAQARAKVETVVNQLEAKLMK